MKMKVKQKVVYFKKWTMTTLNFRVSLKTFASGVKNPRKIFKKVNFMKTLTYLDKISLKFRLNQTLKNYFLIVILAAVMRLTQS